MRKYRLQKTCQEAFEFSAKRFNVHPVRSTHSQDGFIRKHSFSKSVKYGQRVAEFNTRDDVSQCTIDKKVSSSCICDQMQEEETKQGRFGLNIQLKSKLLLHKARWHTG